MGGKVGRWEGGWLMGRGLVGWRGVVGGREGWLVGGWVGRGTSLY